MVREIGDQTMINVMKVNCHAATVAFDPEIEMFRGSFVGLTGGADFYARTVEELHREGAESLRFYLEICEKRGIEPYKAYSGKVSTRLTPERHQALEQIATAHGESINQLLNEGADLVIERYA